MTDAAIKGLNVSALSKTVSATGSVSGSKTRKMDFGSVMNQSLATKANAKDDGLYTNVSGGAKKSDMTDKSQDSQPVSDNRISGAPAADKGTTETVSQKGAADISKTDTTDAGISDDKAVKAEEMLEDIREEIKEIFGCTDEEIENVLAALGLAMGDLLSKANLTEFVAGITGSDGAMALLTDGDLTEKLKMLMSFIDGQIAEVSEEMNISPEELMDLAVQADTHPVFAKAEDTVKEDAGRTQSYGEAQQMQTPSDTAATFAQKVTVTKEGTSDTFSGQQTEQNTNQGFASHSDAAGTIVNTLVQNIDETFAQTLVSEASEIRPSDIIQQIIDSVKVRATEAFQSMEIQLNPEHLGKLHLTVTAREGILTAQITAQDEAVKRAIESQLAVLKDQFNNQGLKVDAVEVTVQSHAFESNQNLNGNEQNDANAGKRTRRNLNLDSLTGLDEEELSNEEQQVIDLAGNGSSVSYTA